MAQANDKILETLKAEMEELRKTNLPLGSPRVLAWMEKVANYLRKDQLKPGECFMVDPQTLRIKKIFVN